MKGIEIMTANQNRRTNNKTKYCIFEILDTDNVGEGVVRQLYEAGYNTIESILK
jgi:replicative superfamily II helicase